MQHSFMFRVLNILLVEDEPMLGPVIAEALLMRGHAATLARTVGEALGVLCAHNDIQVIILDLQIGAERGEDLIDQVRSCTSYIPPIVVHSALSLPDLQKAANDVGASAILQKPVSATYMVETIERVAAWP